MVVASHLYLTRYLGLFETAEMLEALKIVESVQRVLMGMLATYLLTMGFVFALEELLHFVAHVKQDLLLFFFQSAVELSA